jgi:hypothetical protein
MGIQLSRETVIELFQYVWVKNVRAYVEASCVGNPVFHKHAQPGRIVNKARLISVHAQCFEKLSVWQLHLKLPGSQEWTYLTL